MAGISGSTVVAIAQIASTWGTAVAGGATDRIAAEITYSANASELVTREIGSGNEMVTSATKSVIKPTVNLAMDAGYDNNFDKLLAQFMGTSGAPVEQTSVQGDWKHTQTFNTTLNAKYMSIAYTSTDSTTIEFPTCAARSVTIKPAGIPGYLDASFEFVANDIVITSAINTYAAVAASTARTNEMIASAFNDSFWLNATTAGALGSGDKVNVIDWSLTLTRPQECANEITGSTGLGAPLKTGLFEGTFTATLKELPNHTHWTAWSAETKSKLKIVMDGTQIGTGVNRSLSIYLPQAQLITEPQQPLTSPGMNPVTLTWKLSKASANPTGMTSTYPYFEIINTFATSLLA